MTTKEQKQTNLAEVKVKVSQQRIEDLLCNALEGGSNYWYMIDSFNYPEGQTQESLGLEFPHIELPLVPGGSLTISDKEDAQTKATLDKAACIKGLEAMARDEARHFGDWLAENDDATTGDVFLQCALWGKVIYG